jgi:DNA-binding HxlR family transcriptional regulator
MFPTVAFRKLLHYKFNTLYAFKYLGFLKETNNMAKKTRTLDILEFLASKKWMLLVLTELHFHGTQRFNELLENMRHVSPKILSKRLKELEERELITRQRFNEIPPRVEYTLTEKGKELVKSFKDVGKWALQWERDI